ATLAGTNSLRHQEPTMMSGAAAIRSSPDTMRSLAFLRFDSAGNTSMPPAISTSSATQPMPEIIGSSHSSKYTPGGGGGPGARPPTSSPPPGGAAPGASGLPGAPPGGASVPP